MGSRPVLQCQVTVSFNDGSPELAACVRRGPFAVPDENEMLDYLMSRRRVNRATVEQYSLYHVIAYQRCLQLFKTEFLGRGVAPLGNPIDWWATACVANVRTCFALYTRARSVAVPSPIRCIHGIGRKHGCVVRCMRTFW